MIQPNPSVASGSDVCGRRVLLVEDDPDHITIAQHYLKRLDDRIAGVETCSSLGDAEAHIRGGEFELVLLDLTLPDSVLESTIDAIANLAQDGVEIVAMSSLDVPEIRQRVHASGAAAFLSKTKLNAKSLSELLDQLDAPDEPEAPSHGPALAAAVAAVEKADDGGIDGKTLASKLAHDTNSWLANAAFRVATLGQHEGVKGCSLAQDHLASITKSLDAMVSMVQGSRAVFVDEVTPINLEAIDLSQRFPKIVDVWRVSSPKSSLTVEHAGLPMVAADEAALSNLFAIVASNAINHGHSKQSNKPLETVLRFAQTDAPSDEFTTLTVSDDGGPWNVANPERITDPTFRGNPANTHPGLGLYRAKRWMERMGGSLEMVERDDVPGAFSVHLHFRRCR